MMTGRHVAATVKYRRMTFSPQTAALLNWRCLDDSRGALTLPRDLDDGGSKFRYRWSHEKSQIKPRAKNAVSFCYGP
jgi:hypothetical protein